MNEDIERRIRQREAKASATIALIEAITPVLEAMDHRDGAQTLHLGKTTVDALFAAYAEASAAGLIPSGDYVTLKTDDGWTARVEVYPYPVPDYDGALLRWLDEHGHKEVANNYRAHVNECDAAQVDPQDIACFITEQTGISVRYPVED